MFVTVTDSPKNLTLAVLGLGGGTGALPLPFSVVVPVAFSLIEIEPGGRPASHALELKPPRTKHGPAGAAVIGAQRVNPKKDVGHSDFYKEREVAHQLRI